MTRNKTHPWGLIILVTFSLAAMGLLSLVDYEWTLFLSDHRVACWGDFMRQTIFEGDAFGGSDVGILLMVIPSLGYFLSYPGSRFKSLQRWRPYLGFLLFSSLVTGLSIVQGVKWTIGRARPYLVVKKGLPFTHWFEFGPLHVSDGVFFGSFPSGHTATVILMITFSYILIADPSHSLRSRILSWFWGVLVLLYAGLMVIGRSMTLHHWLSDSVGIIFLDWIAIHLIFFTVLKIPRQVDYLRIHGSYPESARYWELRLLWRLLIITLAVMAIIIGIKAVVFQDSPMLILMLIPAIPIGYFMGKNLVKTHAAIMMTFEVTR